MMMMNNDAKMWSMCCMCCAGVPSCPVGPLQVTDVRKSSAVLHWQAPSDDGGRPLVYALSFVLSPLNK